jgi:hypothetical protein
MAAKGRSRLGAGWWLMAFSLLLILALAAQFTSGDSWAGFNWGAEDFVAAALLIGAAGLCIELALRLFRTSPLRLAAIASVLFLFLLVWAELAVGILH